MERYSEVKGKNQREIVLLKAFPCKWGRCTFCDYISDNCLDEKKMVKLNREILSKVTGKYKVLEVINSGSCFELPKETLEYIKEIVEEKGIQKLFFESHWIYKNRLDEMRGLFNVPIIFKCGIETFDDYFRNEVLKKGAKFSGPEEVAEFFKSICLMVGIKGQTKDMIKKDMHYLTKYFERGCINVYIENTTPLKRDEKLIKWFKDEYSELDKNENIEILWNNTDFGVGGEV
ncbi:radical SAM protein [Clostridium ganghwense]|uniref:Radical SAM protein n=1 Tax=Clostridium ganghwense TaxID=312089 RepID=A0ABT4CKL4_9CLOT|nr:radical SAM protein [Clostridium ganghwense]